MVWPNVVFNGFFCNRVYIQPEVYYIENNTWQNPYHPEKPISSRGPLGPRDDIGRG